MMLKNSKNLEKLEILLDNKNIVVCNASLTYGKSISIEFYGSSGQKSTLEKMLGKIHLKLQRSAECYNSNCRDREHKYEISSIDGDGNDIISTYYYRYKKEK